LFAYFLLKFDFFVFYDRLVLQIAEKLNSQCTNSSFFRRGTTWVRRL